MLRNELEQIYSTHRQGLFSLALSIVGCRQRAEDAIHSAFERLWRSSHVPNGDLTSYVFASVRNAARDAVRENHRGLNNRDSIFSDEYTDAADLTTPSDDVLTKERNQILHDAVNQLDADDREVVILKIFAGLTFDSIGEIHEQPAKTVASRYRRALVKLEEQLQGRL